MPGDGPRLAPAGLKTLLLAQAGAYVGMAVVTGRQAFEIVIEHSSRENLTSH